MCLNIPKWLFKFCKNAFLDQMTFQSFSFQNFVYLLLGYLCQLPKASFGRLCKPSTTAMFTIAFIVMLNLKIYSWRKMALWNFAILVLLGCSVSYYHSWFFQVNTETNFHTIFQYLFWYERFGESSMQFSVH